MDLFGFVYDEQGYILECAQWIKKPGNCDEKDILCPMIYEDENGNLKCVNNLVGHGCKHVVKGSSYEKTHYKDIMSKRNKEEYIPEIVQSEADKVINNYEYISSEVLKDPSAVSITGEGKNIRFVCDGKDELDGYVDFLSIEAPWKEDRDTHQLIKGEDGYKILGIVSSYCNLSSSDVYVMYRLVYQRYFEKRRQGRNVSPTIKKKTGFAPIKDINPPEIDIAFDQARLFYRDKKDENYSFGAMFYFFWLKYVNTFYLDEMYYNMFGAFKEHRRPGHLIWDVSSELKLSEALEKIKIYENAYSGRTMMEYIKIIAGSNFKPEMHICENEVLPYLANYLMAETGVFYKERVKKQFELIIQRKLLERIARVFKNRYTEESLDRIAGFIKENEKEDNTVGSIADHASYAVANYLIKYFTALYVFCHNCHEIYKGDRSQCDYEYINKQIKKWKSCREACIGTLKGSLFVEWMKIFNDLFQIEKRLKELESY